MVISDSLLIYGFVFFSSNVPFVRFWFVLLNIGLLSLQRSCLCRKCARSRFEITAFAYLPLFLFCFVWERASPGVLFRMDSAYAHFTVHLRWYFFFLYLYFPPIFRYSTVPLLCSCSSYLHLVWMPFSLVS